MILPIYIYGNSVLRKKCKNIDSDFPSLNDLIQNMYKTMSNANGIGLAAPQIGLAINLFIIDLLITFDHQFSYLHMVLFLNMVGLFLDL